MKQFWNTLIYSQLLFATTMYRIRVTGAHDTILDYADLFTITLRNDDVHDFDTRWDEILLFITKIPPDNVLEVLDAKIASALNRIIHNTQFKRKVSLEEQQAQKEDRFLSGRQIAYLIYEYFRVTGANDSVGHFADLFTIAFEMTIFRNSIRNGTGFFIDDENPI